MHPSSRSRVWIISLTLIFLYLVLTLTSDIEPNTWAIVAFVVCVVALIRFALLEAGDD